MNWSKYIFRSLVFYKKQHFVLFLGTMISATVLTGALIIGDSVSNSLNQLTEKRLGNIQYALQTGERFVTDNLSKRMQKEADILSSGVLHIQASLTDPENEAQISSVNLYGIDSDFLRFFPGDHKNLDADDLLISQHTAQKIGVQPGHELLIKLRENEMVPVQSTFSRDQATMRSLRLNVTDVLDEQSFSRFSLRSDQKAPYNLFVDKKTLQEKTGLENKSNLLVFAPTKKSVLDIEQLNSVFKTAFRLEDASLKTKKIQDEQKIELNSDRIFIDQSIVDSLDHLGNGKILSYLVNSIRSGENSTPYSFVSGLSEELLLYPLDKDEIILNEWCADDLGVRIGDSIQLNYYVLDAFRELITKEKSFKVKDILSNQGNLFHNDLMPDFPGLSDANSCSEWDTGIPIDLDLIRDKDENYWDDYRGTPKGIISFEEAKLLWGNSFGTATAIRMSSDDYAKIKRDFGANFSPGAIGFQIQDVKTNGLVAASNGVDFGELFLSLSFFVLLAGIILLVLLYALNLLTRRSEIEQLRSIGLRNKSIFKLLLSEILILVFIGNLVGVFLGILYNKGILLGLNSIWQDAVRTNALELFVFPSTLLTGFITGTMISIITVYVVLRNMLNKETVKYKPKESGKLWHLILKILSVMLILVCLVFVFTSFEQKEAISASNYMMLGALLIVAMLIMLWLMLSKKDAYLQNSLSINSLAVKYMKRNRQRSFLTVLLLSLGIFSVLVTGMNRKTFSGLETENASGTGGYLFWMETAFPLNYDPNTTKGEQIYGFEEEDIKDSLEFLPLLGLAGDDASCLNLNQVSQPGLLGVEPEILSSRGSFSFTRVLEKINKKDPWQGLEYDYGDGTIPAFVDQTVLTWGLMKSIGDTLIYKDEYGRDLNIIIAGGLANTIFQGYVMISGENMQKYFPSVPGANVCLVDADQAIESDTKAFLEHYFEDYGIDLTLNQTKLDEFNSVTNTYLDVFLILGAIGLLIGTFGFGIVLLRNRIERRKDRAILLALGIRQKSIRKIMVNEHIILLITGTLIAVIGAGYAAIPSYFSDAFSMPYLFLMIILGIILLNGIFWILVFSRAGKDHKNIYSYLRKE